MGPRIGIDVRMASRTGIGRYICGIVNALANDNPNDGYGLIGRAESRGLFPPQFAFLSTEVPIYSVREQWNLPYVGRNFECLHIPHYNAPLFWPRKMVVTIHDLIHLHFPGHLSSPAAKGYACVLLPWIIKKADAIIAVSEHTKKDILETFGEKPEKITVIHHGIDPQFRVAPSPVETPAGKPYFLYVGLMKEHKNLGVMLDAFERIKKRNRDPNLQVRLVGRPDMKQRTVRQWLVRIKQNSDIVFMENISDLELINLYQKAVALIFPSLYEGFGFPLVEAMAAETPVLAARTPSSLEVLGEAGGLYFDPRSSVELENAMTKILKDAELRRRLIAEGKRRLPLFDWRTAAKKTREIYEAVLGSC